MHGNSQPLPALDSLYTVAVLPIVFLILNIIQKTKHIRPADFVKITKPGKILGLMDCDNQFNSSF
jgi:hypothetical protein